MSLLLTGGAVFCTADFKIWTSPFPGAVLFPFLPPFPRRRFRH